MRNLFLIITMSLVLTAEPSVATNAKSETKIIQMASSWGHMCALSSNGRVRCWGRGSEGQLGYGNTKNIGDDETPASAGDVNVGGFVTQIATGDTHTCALLSNGNVRCWGQGILGYGNTKTIGDDETPASAGDIDVGGAVIQIAAGGSHTCALLSTGSVRCWGHNSQGRLGYGKRHRVGYPIGDNETPASVGDIDLGGVAIQIAAGEKHTCALLDTGNVRCWGSGRFGRLGYGNKETIGDDESPASAGDVDVGGAVISIVTGYNKTCAVLTTGGVKCWGDALSYGPLGYANTETIGDNETPASVGEIDMGGKVKQVSVGAFAHICAVLNTGNVRCWGDAGGGQLGYGNKNMIGDNETPASAGDVIVGGEVSQVAVGYEHTCALMMDGNVRCWGIGSYGERGYGKEVEAIGDNELPVTVDYIEIF